MSGNYQGLLLHKTVSVVLGQPLEDVVISSPVGEFELERHIAEGGKNLVSSE
jgi:hypothetical protein